MKRAMNLLAGIALLGSATLGLAGCAAATDGDVTLAGSYYGPACAKPYPDYCDGYWNGRGWGGDHWWRHDQFHHIHDFSHVHGFDHGDAGFAHGGGFGHAGFGHGGGGHGR